MWVIEKIIKKGDYNYCIVRNHPNRTENDYVLHHRVVVENHLGRLLTKDEVVHHIDGDKKNNDILNLEIMNQSEHAKHHGKDKGRTYIQLKCPNCERIFEMEKRDWDKNKKSSGFRSCNRSCGNKFAWKIKKEGYTPEIIKSIAQNIVSVYNK